MLRVVIIVPIWAFVPCEVKRVNLNAVILGRVRQVLHVKMVYVSSMFSHVLRIVIVIRIVAWEDFAFRRRVVNPEMEATEEMGEMEEVGMEVGGYRLRKLLLLGLGV
jgi:hypothetical protein